MKLSKVATRLKRNRPKWRIALGKGIKPRFFRRHEPEITKIWSFCCCDQKIHSQHCGGTFTPLVMASY